MELVEKFNDSYALVSFKTGNLFTNSGDILLCPTSEDFKFSNPLSIRLAKRERKMKRWIDFYKGKECDFKTEHCIFLPCRKLKYRGVIFVSLDFYSEGRRDVNKVRVKEAFDLAQRFHCTKISLPKNILYSPYYKEGDYGVYDSSDLLEILQVNSNPISFDVEFIFNIPGYRYKGLSFYSFRYGNHKEMIPFSGRLFSWYRRQDKMSQTEYFLTKPEVCIIRKILCTCDGQKKQLSLVLCYLKKRLGNYSESGVDRANIGGEMFLDMLLEELPWTKRQFNIEYDILNIPSITI